MSQAQAQAATANGVAAPASPAAATTADDSGGRVPSYDQRIAQVTADLNAANDAAKAKGADGQAAETAADAPDVAAKPTEKLKDAPAEAAPAKPETDAQRAERRKRLDELTAREQAQADARKQAQRLAEVEQQLAAARSEAEALKAREWIDPSKVDPASFFDLAKKFKVPPAELGEWIRKQTEDPDRHVVEEAQRIIDPKLSALEAKIAEQQKQIDAYNAQLAQQRQIAEVAAIKNQFVSHVSGVGERAPLTAQLLKEHGPDELWRLADSVAERLPQGAGPDALIDAIEEHLDGPSRAYVEKLAKFYGYGTPGSPAQAAAASTTATNSTPPNPKTRRSEGTVPNSLAQQRASVVDDEEEWAAIPLEERAARLKRAL